MQGLKYLNLALLSAGGILLLFAVFAINPQFAGTIKTDGINWIQWTSVLLALGIIMMELICKSNKFVFCHSDVIFLILLGFEFIFYDSTLNPQPFRLYFLGQLILIWFMIRAAFQTYPQLRVLFRFIIIWTGVIFGILGLEALYNSKDSGFGTDFFNIFRLNQNLFNLYIALIYPLPLNGVFRFHKCKKMDFLNTYTSFFYFSLFAWLFFTYILISSNCYISWILAGIGVLWVIGFRMRNMKMNNRKKMIARISVWCVAVVFIVFSCFIIKDYTNTNIAKQQMMNVKISTKILFDKPFTGIGLGKFPTSYAATQLKYLNSPDATESDRIYASTPYISANAYLQSGIECGIISISLFFIWLLMSLYHGVRNNMLGASGVIISILVLCFIQTPLQYPAVWIILIFCSAVCVTRANQGYKGRKYSIRHIGLIAAIVACISFCIQSDYSSNYNNWHLNKRSYLKGAYHLAADNYRLLYPELNYEPEFLYEGADCLSRTGESHEAIVWLKRALQLSSEPKFYYAMADNLTKQKRYYKAERTLIRLNSIVPMRAETYLYLLRLYSSPEYKHPIRFKKTLDIFLQLRDIKESGITTNMIEEANQLKAETLGITKET